MRRLQFFLVICLVVLLALTITSAACATDSEGVTVTVKIVRVIHVSPSGAVRSNTGAVSLETAGLVTFVSP